MTLRPLLLILMLGPSGIGLLYAQPCLTGWTLTANPLPAGGTYASGQTVTFCYTVTGWNSTSANWFHGAMANWGAGWDLSTLVPGPPPATCGTSNGQWGWYNSVQGTAFTNIGPQGPGFFFDLNNDGNPGNNFGDFCTGSTNWQFCWTISVLSGADCSNGLDLGMSVNTFSDSETGSWSSSACTNDPIVPSTPAVTECCDVDAGTDGAVVLCNTSAAADLFAALGGTPDAGGAWTGPDGLPHPGTFDPATGLDGPHTYTVTGTGNCDATATVVVTVNIQADAGADGSITVCAGDPAFPLIAHLSGGPTAGGTWTAPGGGAFGNTFNPAVDPSGLYTYTVSGVTPCVDVSASVSVTVNPSATAGSNGTLIVCSNGVPSVLFTFLGGNPDPGGTWTTAGGAVFSGTYIPGVDPPGPYLYTVPGSAPCPNSTATVTVTENLAPDAGIGANAAFCDAQAATPLVDWLAGNPQPGGVWTGPGGAASNGTLQPGSAPSGTYTYTIVGLAPCMDAQAELNVTIVPQPDAGTSSILNLCDGSPPADLFNALDGAPDAGGNWTGPDGQPVGSTFTPGSSVPGIHAYSITAITPCTDVAATVTVTVSPQPDAGSNGNLAICSSSPPTDLFTILGGTPQAGGNWTAPGGGASTGIFTPLADSDGVYTYTIAGVAPCITTSATVTVTTTPANVPGTDGALTVCTTGPVVDLFPELGGSPQAGGTWSTPSGVPSTGTIDPSTADPGFHTYTLPATGPCPAASAGVALTIAQPPDAGTYGSTTLCSSPTTSIALIGLLGGTPQAGGTWSGPLGQSTGPDFIVGTSEPGSYVYTVNAPPPCSSASSQVDVYVSQASNSGIGGQITLCENGSSVDPSSWLAGNPDPGGSWTDPSGPIVASVEPATAPSGTYTYTVPGLAPCPNAQTTVTLIVSPLPYAGSDAPLLLCEDAANTLLLNSLPGADPGGTWSGPGGIANGTFVPGSNQPGDYTYTVNGTSACAGTIAEAIVTVTVSPSPNADFNIVTTSGCSPLQVQFAFTNPLGLQSATWDHGDGSSGNGAPLHYHTYGSAGSFSVQTTVTDVFGCSNSSMQSNAVYVSDGPEAFFVPSPLVVSVEDPEIEVVHEPVTGNTYAWTVDGSAIEGGDVFKHVVSPPEVGYHTICLIATDALGCANELCVEFLVDDVLTLFVPNAFTPDGSGLNDEWRPSVLGADPERYELIVFDRWGLEVFSSKNLMDSWNGAYRNGGEILPQDVYVWRLLVRDQFSTEQREYLGTVTLLK